MKANKVWFFSEVIEKNKRVFKVPVYQRNYDWKNSQCEMLYKDILYAGQNKKHHFTGTIVYVEQTNGGSGLSEVLIIDGQQRLTTIYILLKSILDLAIENNEIRIESEIKDVMFNRNCDDQNKVKLKSIETDNKQLLLLIEDKIDEMNRDSNVYKAYYNFKRLIQESMNEGIELPTILDGVKELEVVEIVLDKSNGDEPQKIFESINSTGLALSLSDLIRNYLLMDEKNQEILYKEYWLEIEKNVDYKNLEDFIINFVNSEVTKNVNSKNAYQLFKENCEEKKLTHKEVLINLKRKSKYYGAFIGKNNFYDREIQYYLNSFYNIKQTLVLPFLFKIFEDFEENKIKVETLVKVLEYLLSYIIRISSVEVTKNLNKQMKSLYSRAINNDYDNYYERFVSFLNNLKTNDKMPKDEEFTNSLIFKPIYTKSICKFLLASIENHSKEKIDTSNLSVEHILPQKENAVVWKKELGDEYRKVYDSLLHTLGNLTFSGYNSELGTKSFEEKKKIIYANSKAKILNKDILESQVWNYEAIVNRAKNLSKFLLEKFAYKNISFDTNLPDNFYYNINERYDFSNTKPQGFVFMEEFFKVSSWANLLSKLLEVSYDLNNELFINLAKSNYSIENATRIYITNDERKLKQPSEIRKTGIFYETNLGSNNIISFVKDILKLINSEPEDFGIYLDTSL